MLLYSNIINEIKNEIKIEKNNNFRRDYIRGFAFFNFIEPVRERLKTSHLTNPTWPREGKKKFLKVALKTTQNQAQLNLKCVDDARILYILCCGACICVLSAFCVCLFLTLALLYRRFCSRTSYRTFNELILCLNFYNKKILIKGYYY